MQRDPGTGCVADVVMKIIARSPARHRALFYPERETSFFARFQQRYEMLLEIDQVSVDAVLLIAAYKSANSVHTQQRRGLEHTHHEVVLFLSERRIFVKHI